MAQLSSTDTAARILALVAPGRRDLLVIVTYALGSGIFGLAVPVAAQALLESVAFTSLLPQVVALTFLLGLGLAAAVTMTLAQVYLVELISRRVFVHAYRRAVARVVRAVADDVSEGLVGRAARFYDVAVTEKALGVLLTDGIAVVLQVGLGLLLLALYHPLLLAFDLGLVVFLAFVVFVLGRRALATARDESAAKHAAAAYLLRAAAQVPGRRGWRNRTRLETGAAALGETWLRARAAHFRIVLVQVGGMLFAQVVASVIVLGIGGLLVVSGELTVGQLAAAEIVVALTVGALARGGKLLAKVYDLAAAIEKLETVFTLDVEDDQGARGAEEGGVAISWSHPAGEVTGQRGALVEVDVGVRDALVGAVRAHLDGPGADARVLVDGIDLRALARPWARERIIIVDDIVLPAGSARQVLQYLAPGAGDDEIARALEAMGIAAVILDHPDRLDASIRSLAAHDVGIRDALVLAGVLAAAPGAVILGPSAERIERRHLDAFLRGARSAERAPTIIRATGTDAPPVDRREGGVA